MRRLIALSIGIAALLISFSAEAAKEKKVTLNSPDNRTIITVTIGEEITWSVIFQGTEVIAPSTLSMEIESADGRKSFIWGNDSRLRKVSRTTSDRIISSPIYKSSSVREHYNQMELYFREDFGLIFRAYDEGVAYRFYGTRLKEDDKVKDELAEFNFNQDRTAYIPYSTGNPNPYRTSFENRYEVKSLSSFDKEKIAFSPLLVCLDGDFKAVITESDLESYPGMFLEKSGEFSLRGRFAPIPSEIEVHPTRCQERPTAYSDILALIRNDSSKKSPRYFPWRVIAISDKDTRLPENNLVWLLAPENRIEDISWIKPGKVAWDWWNNWGVTGVEFQVGINTATYKHYIDFTSANGIEYVILDEGWSPPKEGDIMKVIPEIDLEELVSYGRERNVELILWAVAYPLDKKLEQACSHYSAMGIKGFKVDFMDRDDQDVVELNHRIAEVAAKYRMLINFHGMYKPAGLNRTWPNVINFEGVWGLEQMKWSKEDMVSYDVTFPYIRMLSGPVDYTQGAMRNAIRRDYVPNYNNPMSQGTRARQVAEYIIFDSPLVMLCDNPTIYTKEQETTDFITAIPTVWDETRVLQGELGKYIVTARRSGGTWYIGGMTDWEERDITLDVSFLLDGNKSAGKGTITLFRDGPNAHRSAHDYTIETLNVVNYIARKSTSLTIHLAPGGGFAMVVE
ncbi:MAG TPA: glycoside hydrolase family 97 protein [Bacteroidales bacterium]|jgi:alpha-glucosidase|nr:glycoside hydrolase family 97 protein [Bacteroidales bacterium]HPK29961.1 glycoside hydrolase family 97 protein [Bacteroidales bacterium]